MGEMKKLRTELAVERNNRSLVAKELQQVGKERDGFMQRFMELERELRSRHRSASESVMTSLASQPYFSACACALWRGEGEGKEKSHAEKYGWLARLSQVYLHSIAEDQCWQCEVQH